jgi:hypothetical protein
MKKRFMLIGILAVALILPFAVHVEKAGADAIMFPWIVKDASLSTILSVVNTAQGDVGIPEQLHYQYWYKQTTANTQTQVCDNISFKRPTSKDDIVTFDAAGNINGGQPMFGDGVSPANVVYSDQVFDLNVANPRRAFLLVDNNTPSFADDVTNVDGTLYGEAMVLEIGGGAAWGYIAYNASGGETTDQNNQIYFDDGRDMLGEVIGVDETTQTTLMPPDTIATRFFMTPVNDVNSTGTTDPGNGQRDGDTDASIQLCIDPDQSGGCDEGGIFDQDENRIDFEKVKGIVCTSGDDLEDLMTEASINTFTATGGQGWAYIVTDSNVTAGATDAFIDSDGMIIGKLEWTVSGVTLNGTTVGGALNNFVWLRDSATVAGAYGINNIHNCTSSECTGDTN